MDTPLGSVLYITLGCAKNEVDTDRMAVEVRAALARDPKGFERAVARQLTATAISTGR